MESIFTHEVIALSVYVLKQNTMVLVLKKILSQIESDILYVYDIVKSNAEQFFSQNLNSKEPALTYNIQYWKFPD